MIEFKTKKPTIVINLDESIKVSFDTSKVYLKDFDNLKDTDYVVQFKEYKKKRSLSQNAYMWVLLGELGNKLVLPRETLYKSYIKDYGKVDYLPVKNEAVDMFISAWQQGRTGNLAEVLRDSKFNGYTTIAIYYGSSTYNSTEMAHLIEPIVRDCEEQGIQTMTYDEIMLLHNENN